MNEANIPSPKRRTWNSTSTSSGERTSQVLSAVTEEEAQQQSYNAEEEQEYEFVERKQGSVIPEFESEMLSGISGSGSAILSADVPSLSRRMGKCIFSERNDWIPSGR